MIVERGTKSIIPQESLSPVARTTQPCPADASLAGVPLFLQECPKFNAIE
jgi:hypothetical protein